MFTLRALGKTTKGRPAAPTFPVCPRSPSLTHLFPFTILSECQGLPSSLNSERQGRVKGLLENPQMVGKTLDVCAFSWGTAPSVSEILEKMCDLKEAKNNGPGPLYLNTVYRFDQVNLH